MVVGLGKALDCLSGRRIHAPIHMLLCSTLI